MIQYCTRCVMPSTKPDLFIDDEGVCSACRSFENRPKVDWAARRRLLIEILETYRSKGGSNYDCVIPVSGGKDSLYQVLKVKELGFNPLCVNFGTCHLTGLGRRNIENLKQKGVDYIEAWANPGIRRKLNRIGLLQIGDIAWPEHVGIFTSPVRLAVQMGIPLIVWGENSQNEFGGPAAAAENNVLNRRWLEEFGGLLGLRVSDIPGQDEIEAKDLIQYTYPTDSELERVGVTGVFLGYYLPWDGHENALFAQENGFEFYHKPVEGAVNPYENLDNCQHGIHDYFKFLKFGFGRATDHACLHIRRGRMSRADGIEAVKRHDGKFPWEYLGVSLADILGGIGVTVEEFIKICDRFTSHTLFLRDNEGKLIRDVKGNLSRVNDDNP